MSIGLLVFLFCAAGYMAALYKFCAKYFKTFRMDKRIFIILLTVMEAVINLNGSVGTRYFLSVIISHVLFVGLFFVAFTDFAMKKIFAAMILIAVKTLVWDFGVSLFSCIVLAFQKQMTDGQIPYVLAWQNAMIGGATYCLVIFVLAVLREKLVLVFEAKMESWYLMMSVLLACVIVVADLVNWGTSSGIMVVSDVGKTAYRNAYYNQLFSHLSICFFTAMSACIAMGMVFFMNKIYIQQRQKQQYDAQIAFYKMLNEQYRQMERLRHDMKNHILVLHGLWKKQQFDQAGTYLEKMMKNGNIGAGEEATGNHVIDVLLYHKKKEAEAFSIPLISDVQFPKSCTVDEFDLCVLLGNLLDNAIKACAKMADDNNRFVEIQLQPIKKCLLLVMKNGTDLEDVKEIKTGTGLLNIYETVRKYDGIVRMNVQEHVFEISVLIPMTDMT